MLQIIKSTKENKLALKTHVEAVSCMVKMKVFGKGCGLSDCNVCKFSVTMLTGIPIEVLEYLKIDGNIENILVAEPKDQYKFANKMWMAIIPGFSKTDFLQYLKLRRNEPKKPNPKRTRLLGIYRETTDILYKIFDYATWFQNSKNESRYDAYSLATGLDRNTCTYCNRLWTSTVKTVEGKKIMRPTFDHWYRQKRYPMLALSFFNLIPSCNICNSSIKASSDYHVDDHIHPYGDDPCEEHFYYSFEYGKSVKEYKVEVMYYKNDKKLKSTIEGLMLKDVYNSHQSEIADILKLKDSYSEKYVDKLTGLYLGLKLDENEIYRLAFGVELLGKDFYKLPLSKFKKDILAGTGLLRYFGIEPEPEA